jgi:hypothetical protein
MTGWMTENVFGLTPLPGGGYAEYAWTSLSHAQRSTLEGAVKARDLRWLPIAPSRTLSALARRGITERQLTRKLTERGQALLRWRMSPDAAAWLATEQK